MNHNEETEPILIEGTGHVWIADESDEWKYIGQVKEGKVTINTISTAWEDCGNCDPVADLINFQKTIFKTSTRVAIDYSYAKEVEQAYHRSRSRKVRLDQRRHARMRHVAIRAALGQRSRRTRGP